MGSLTSFSGSPTCLERSTQEMHAWPRRVGADYRTTFVDAPNPKQSTNDSPGSPSQHKDLGQTVSRELESNATDRTALSMTSRKGPAAIHPSCHDPYRTMNPFVERSLPTNDQKLVAWKRVWTGPPRPYGNGLKTGENVNSLRSKRQPGPWGGVEVGANTYNSSILDGNVNEEKFDSTYQPRHRATITPYNTCYATESKTAVAATHSKYRGTALPASPVVPSAPGGDHRSRNRSRNNYVNYQAPQNDMYVSVARGSYCDPKEQKAPFQIRQTFLTANPDALDEYKNRWTKSAGDATRQRINTTEHLINFKGVPDNQFQNTNTRSSHVGLWH